MLFKKTGSKRIAAAIGIFTKAQTELEEGIKSLKEENAKDARKLDAHSSTIKTAVKTFSEEQAARADKFSETLKGKQDSFNKHKSEVEDDAIVRNSEITKASKILNNINKIIK